ncbi:MAG TPA: PilZ domain-containing protein [Syntrophorhabdaceae bacterium]|nr:PilZ domain-containing protein [Syntrophorhabdaceae bacterium]HOD74540.1 PilZ domain-containing protein [Syntrophorhabdaceae bacterium]
MNIRPGLNINIIINIDHMRETVDVGNSIIHEMAGDRMIVAQTDPPVSRTHLGKELFVTFLDRSGGEPHRFGFPAIVLEFLKEFELSASLKKVQALVLRKAGDFEEYNLRMFYRLEPPSDCGIRIAVDGKGVNLIDISIGGAKFSHEKVFPFEIGEPVRLSLYVDEVAYPVEAKVLRVWEPENERIRKTVALASVQFTDMEAYLKNVLARKIRDVEREMRYKELHPAR